jgi:hypothetical protein
MTASPATSGLMRRFLALDGSERRLLLAAAFAMPVFALALRLAGIDRMQRWVGSVTGVRREGAAPARIAWLAAAAARHGPIRATCLVRGLLTTYLLRRRGFDACLRVGVRLVEGRLEAHAWTECDGIALGEAADVAERYAPFADALGAAPNPSP